MNWASCFFDFSAELNETEGRCKAAQLEILFGYLTECVGVS